jgi:hypothetical protein
MTAEERNLDQAEGAAAPTSTPPTTNNNKIPSTAAGSKNEQRQLSIELVDNRVKERLLPNTTALDRVQTKKVHEEEDDHDDDGEKVNSTATKEESSERQSRRKNGGVRNFIKKASSGDVDTEKDDDEQQREGQNSSGTGGFKKFMKKFSFGDSDRDKDDDPFANDNDDNGQDNQNKNKRSLLGSNRTAGLNGGGNVRWFHNLFPLRQLFVPRVPYPVWDHDWDGNEKLRRRLQVFMSKGENPTLVTRHILLIRHGQYIEKYKDDKDRILTTLGKIQAQKTGKRIAKIVNQSRETSPVKRFSVSDMTRSKETAEIIYKELEDMYEEHNKSNPNNVWDFPDKPEPDFLLNEGFPGTTQKKQKHIVMYLLCLTRGCLLILLLTSFLFPT